MNAVEWNEQGEKESKREREGERVQKLRKCSFSSKSKKQYVKSVG